MSLEAAAAAFVVPTTGSTARIERRRDGLVGTARPATVTVVTSDSAFFSVGRLVTAAAAASVAVAVSVRPRHQSCRASRRVARRFFGQQKANEDRWEKQREEERAREDAEADPGLNEIEMELAAEVAEEEAMKEREAEEKREKFRLQALKERYEIEIEEISKQSEEKEANCQRLQGEFDNFKRRCGKDLSAARDQAAIPLVEELLEISDTYQLAVQNTTISKEGEQAVMDRFEALFGKMLASWSDVGVHKVEALGQEFDPKVHEAVSMIPSTEYKEDIVCNELRAGWVLKSDDDDEEAEPQVLRPSMVCVSSGPGPS
eukprot:TRINITY_DN31917_c0_g1_i1.p1 TRINITY_DN31917_c0_g1~~TRINITY_DN31917_c0_g1_i1.p1  ORF type:complete len:317 (-),score=87.32 TRINITY_DN31917_c0_g1_i1:63-1013(-)